MLKFPREPGGRLRMSLDPSACSVQQYYARFMAASVSSSIGSRLDRNALSPGVPRAIGAALDSEAGEAGTKK
jgi:hypothetical protein